VVLLLAWIGSFMSFGLVQVMTDGGPSYSSELFATLVYKNAFAWFDLPYAAALGIILLVLMMLPGFAYIRTQLKVE
jgi:ABC-type sugar transport system permease subunit